MLLIVLRKMLRFQLLQIILTNLLTHKRNMMTGRKIMKPGSMMKTEIRFIEVYFQLQVVSIILEYMSHTGLQAAQFLKKE